MNDFIRQLCQNQPQEMCGFVFLENNKLRATSVQNSAADPVAHFRIEPAIYLEARQQAGYLGYWHSHPSGGDASEPDRAASEELCDPVWTYDVPADRLTCYRPGSMAWVPLMGRPFIPGLWDCVTFVRDYFQQERGIALPHFDYTEDAFLYGLELDIRGLIESASGKLVSSYREGDLLAIQTGTSQRPNHLAVMGPNNTLLHQTERLSRADLYSDQWRKRTLWGVRL